jgi:hypothetical protein
MSDVKLGSLLDGSEQRDAIHIAIAPVVAGKDMEPGDRIVFEKGSTTTVIRGSAAKAIGIVDPFLRAPIAKGQRFYMFLLPNTIASLRHDWTHPAFGVETPVIVEADPVDAKSIGEKWIAEYAARAGAKVEELMNAANDYLKYDEYFCQGGRWEGEHLPDDFWDHYEAVTGEKVTKRGSFYSCSC